jgi:hypothetical protein
MSYTTFLCLLYHTFFGLSRRIFKNFYFFFIGANSNATVVVVYTPYPVHVTAFGHGKLISGWFNAKIMNTMALTNIANPMIL